MQIVQIVKRYGPVGGMEEYAYQLSIELSKMGHEVVVICEKSYVAPSMGVSVVEIGFHRKPNWLAHYRFSRKVSKWLVENDSPQRIVHSHERQVCHNITTFHTTPFGHGSGAFFRFLSSRNYFYDRLEKRELFNPNVKAVVPVSNVLKGLILDKYPFIKDLLKEPIHPGVDLSLKSKVHARSITFNNTIGFIGREWKRKGLEKAIRVWRLLKRFRPSLRLHVAGAEPSEIQHLFAKNEQDFQLFGFISDKLSFYQSLDLLIHPANLEAFGMVIGESLNMKVPVLCSLESGAAEILSEETGLSLSVEEDDEQWCLKAEELLDLPRSEIQYDATWYSVAKSYLLVYQSILKHHEAN